MEDNNQNVNRTGLWVTESKNGIKYMRGTLNIEDKSYDIKIFKNERKKTEKHPDYNMLYDIKEKKVTPVPDDDTSVQLTDEDYDKMLQPKEEEQIELPF